MDPRLNALTPQRIEGTDGASGPFWSPDGQFIGFFADGKLKKIGLGGEPAQNICNITTGLGATWSPSGDIVFAGWNRSELNRVAHTGGSPKPITTLDAKRGENSPQVAAVSARRAAFSVYGAQQREREHSSLCRIAGLN